MKWRPLLFGLMLLAQSPPQRPSNPADGASALRIDTTVVTLPVTVMDKQGRFVANLRRESFRLYEDGVEQQIEFFQSIEAPVTIAILLDVSDSTESRFEEIKAAAIEFVNQLRANDRVMLVTFDRNITVLSTPTDDLRRIQDIIRFIRPGGGTRLYDTIELVAREHLRPIRGRKGIVLFTDGVDTESQATWPMNARAVEESDAFVYPIQYTAVPKSPQMMNGIPVGAPRYRGNAASAGPYLNDLAEKSGGRFFMADTLESLRKSFATIAVELRNQYSLGYYPSTEKRAGQRRKLKIQVDQPAVVIRARKSYIAGGK